MNIFGLLLQFIVFLYLLAVYPPCLMDIFYKQLSACVGLTMTSWKAPLYSTRRTDYHVDSAYPKLSSVFMQIFAQLTPCIMATAVSEQTFDFILGVVIFT